MQNNIFCQNFFVISFSYKKMSIEQRENFVKSKYKTKIENFFEKGDILGYVIVETCLRIEIYLETKKDFEINNLICQFDFQNINFLKNDAAVFHLFDVICGLDSVIKGEDQVLAQIKKAYFKCLENKKTSKLLNIIFNSAIETGKKFRTESKINEKNMSLDSISVKFIKEKVKNIEDKTIFIIGVGDLTQSILTLFHKMGHKNLIVTNRSERKSTELKKVYDNIRTAKFSQKYEFIKKSDVIISATSAPHLIVEYSGIKDILRDEKERFFLDLAVPRDIDSKITAFKNVFLYNLDDIWELYNQNVEKREQIVENFFYIIEEQLEKLKIKLEKQKKYSKN